MPPDLSRPVNLDEAAHLLSLPRWMLDRFVAEGRIAVHDGTTTVAALHVFVNSLPTEPDVDRLALADPATLARAGNIIRGALARQAKAVIGGQP